MYNRVLSVKLINCTKIFRRGLSFSVGGDVNGVGDGFSIKSRFISSDNGFLFVII